MNERPAVITQPAAQFGEALHVSLTSGRFDRLILANFRGGDAGLQRVIGRRILLRGQVQLSLLLRYKTRDVTQNFSIDAGVAKVLEWLAAEPGVGCGHGHLRSIDEAIDLRISKKGQVNLQRDAHAAALPAAAAHDRIKHRLLQPDAAFWQDLGVTDRQGVLIPAMSRKWKQINKFVEVLDAAWRESPLADRDRSAAPPRVMDFGAGKGYLSFAVATYLQQMLGAPADVVGVELRGDLVELCNRSVAQRGVAGLAFEQGDVVTHPIGAIDIMIALHACDTATDHAIHKGIMAGAQIILCSPCCHKQLRPQLQSPGVLRPMLQHGIHLGQQAEMITDSLRALLLEAHGYRTQVFEFVALEHTSKNKMILAIRRAGPAPTDAVLAQIRAIKDFYGVREHCLERLLAETSEGTATAAPRPRK